MHIPGALFSPPPESRRLRIARWALTLPVAAIMLVWFFSGWLALRIDDPAWILRVQHGFVRLTLNPAAPTPPMPVARPVSFIHPLPAWDFKFDFWRDTAGSPVYTLSIWIPVLPFALLTLWLWRFHIAALFARARHRRRLGLCPSCGYDRRGLTTPATCPECGTAPSPVNA